MKLKLRAIGASTGVLLPKAMLIRLEVKKGDTLFAVETPAGYLLTRYHREVWRSSSDLAALLWLSTGAFSAY